MDRVTSITTQCGSVAGEYNIYFTYHVSDNKDYLNLMFSAKTGMGIYSHFSIAVFLNDNTCYCTQLYKRFNLNLLDGYVRTLCDLIAE